MGVRFDHPWALLLFLPLICWAFYTIRTDFRLKGARKKWVIGLRTFILSLLVMALAGANLYSLSKVKNVVFLLDRSDSMNQTAEIEQWITEASAAKEKADQVGVVSIGLNAAVEKNLDPAPVADSSLGAEVNKQFTRLEQGLQLSGTMFSGSGNHRIVLISDGQDNTGDALRAATALKERGVAVDVLPVAREGVKDVAIDEFVIPEKLYLAEAFTFELSIRSTFATQGELRLYEDQQEIGRQMIALEKGDNRLALQGLAKEAGLHRYRAEIFVVEDEQTNNNVYEALTRVAGSPKVLIVEGQKGTSANLVNALKSSLIDHDVLLADMLPSDLAKYARYDSIIFNNVSGDHVGGKQMEWIEQAVRSYGIGFVMLGGENSYGMGGYYKTPIEKLLPVSMELEGKRKVPSLALMLVIDRSGSMSGDKMELAKEAAIRTVELLRPQDTVGVVAFDDEPWWVVAPQKLEDRKDVLSLISSIPARGGTNIYPALAEAVQEIVDSEAQRKHIIVLTDGQSAIDSGYNKLIEQIKGAKATMSTVAVGSDADVKLLQWLAEQGEGRYYFVKDETTLPAIFSRESAMIARSYIVDKPFVPSMVTPGDWEPLFRGGVPMTYGYVATTPKSTAQVVLSSPEPDPLLARWQYGSGRTVAWTSDVTGQWSKGWVNQPIFAKTFAEMVKWTYPQFSASPYAVKTEIAGNEVHFEVTANGDQLPDQLQANIASDASSGKEISLLPVSPGVYTGVMEVSEPGSFLMNIRENNTDGQSNGTGSGNSNVTTGKAGAGTEAGVDVGENTGEGIADDRRDGTDGKVDGIVEDTVKDAGEGAVEDTVVEPDTGASTGTGFVIPYSPEYRLSQEDGQLLLEKLAERTGGRVLSWNDAEEVFAFKPKAYAMDQSLIRLLLIVALLLWVLDIALRRLALPWGQLAKALFGRLAGRKAKQAEERRSRWSGAQGAVASEANATIRPDESGAGVNAGLARLAVRKQRAAAFYGAGGGADAAAPHAQPSPASGGAGAAHGRPASEAVRAVEPPAAPPAEGAGRGAPDTGGAVAGDALGRLLEAKRRGKR